MHWHNHQRLHTYLGDVPPAEFEGGLGARRPTLPYNPTSKRLETNKPTLQEYQGGSIASGVPCLVRVPGHMLGAVAYACAFWGNPAGWGWLGWALSARLDANLVRDWMPGPGRESLDWQHR